VTGREEAGLPNVVSSAWEERLLRNLRLPFVDVVAVVVVLLGAECAPASAAATWRWEMRGDDESKWPPTVHNRRLALERSDRALSGDVAAFIISMISPFPWRNCTYRAICVFCNEI
jgi:hypothetical protein